MKQFGRKQQIGIGAMAFGFTGSIILCVLGFIDGGQWVSFNQIFQLGVLGGLFAGAVGSDWTKRGSDDEVA